MTILEIGGFLVGAYVSGWVSGFLIMWIKRAIEAI